MRDSKFPAWKASGLTLIGAGVLIATMATPAGAHSAAAPCTAGACDKQSDTQATATSPQKADSTESRPSRRARTTGGIIGRNTLGGPNAVLREGPYGRTSPTFAATQAPPHGTGSLGIIVGSGNDKIAFGNETIFANTRLSSIRTLRYWVFAGVDSLTGVVVPNITIEVDPNVGTSNYTSLVYLPNISTAPSAPTTPAPNVWQRYDAGATGNQWYATGTTGTTIGCTQATPCSFAQLKERLPDAVVSLSLGISKGRDTSFRPANSGWTLGRTAARPAKTA